MPRPTPVAPELIRAIAHPVRLRIFGALDQQPMTLSQLMREIGADRRSTLRHLHRMEHAGVVCSVSGPAGLLYEATTIPYVSDDEDGALPVGIRRAGVAVSLANVQAAAASALSDGGFDRADIHISRTSFAVDPAAWQRVADELAEVLERVDAIRDDAAADAPAEDAINATAVIMLFENGSRAQDGGAGLATFSHEEALLRAWDLTERLSDRLVPAQATDWASIIADADRLRVLASAALSCERERTSVASS